MDVRLGFTSLSAPSHPNIILPLHCLSKQLRMSLGMHLNSACMMPEQIPVGGRINHLQGRQQQMSGTPCRSRHNVGKVHF